MNLGVIIRAHRVASGMTAAELATMTETTTGAIQRIESGATRACSSKLLLRIASALGTTVDRMYQETEEREEMLRAADKLLSTMTTKRLKTTITVLCNLAE